MKKSGRKSPVGEVLGLVRSPFREKFGIPRQAGLVDAVEGQVVMLPPFDDPVMFKGLADFSHIWLTFVFHECEEQGWRKQVRPPRLGGNQRVGVFASRSPFRPNHLGLSAVRLLKIDTSDGVCLTVSGLDLLDGTPVLDIKPYLPYADRVEGASGGFAAEAPGAGMQVVFDRSARAHLDNLAENDTLEQMIVGLLSMDPRPAYQADPERIYGMRLAACDIRWRVADGRVEVLEINPSAD